MTPIENALGIMLYEAQRHTAGATVGLYGEACRSWQKKVDEVIEHIGNEKYLEIMQRMEKIYENRELASWPSEE